jgi:peptidyl-prolyl cis-trans isomerase SurA
MPFPRAITARFLSLAGRCIIAGVASVALSFSAAAQGGTVAVTGDGTSTTLKPSVGDPTADLSTGQGKNQKKKKGSAANSANTETASRESSTPPSSDQRAITALVNDEPITGFEVEQRAMMLSGTNVQAQAKANFEAIVKNPKTSERLKAILQDTAKSNEGKSRDEIIAIFERRKKEFGMSLQKQAFESAKATALPAMKKQAIEELIDDRLKLQEAKNRASRSRTVRSTASLPASPSATR